MAITGYLADFSLAEIFELLENGSKTGLLTICPLKETGAEDKANNHYVWFSQGRTVAAANTLDQQGLVRLIAQRGWLGDRAALRLAQTGKPGTPLGLSLKAQNALNADQLKLLFYAQVMQQVCALFALKDGWFQFDTKAPLSSFEMTGLSAPATEVTLAGLRALKDWSALQDKLPLPTSALISAVEGKPEQKLNQVEWQVWEFTNGAMPLQAIAKQLQLSIEKIQQVAFRFIVIGLAEETPLVQEPVASIFSAPNLLEPVLVMEEAPHAVSQSFLKNLVSFLKKQVV
jgi:hypothetical protein